MNWSEWNGIYRDEMRDFWRGNTPLSSLASRLTGSADLYDDGRTPRASINFITAHDGFTLRDMVSYNEKHNEANLEDNQDGTDDNRSWNCGAEGETGDPDILALRARQTRNLMATLLLSQGTPMLLGGDEFGRSQGGNNNAWCQDSPISWFDWAFDEEQERMLAFTRRVIALRQEHPVFRRKEFLTGSDVNNSGLPDSWWFRPEGRRMTRRDWERDDIPALGLFLNGNAFPYSDSRGKRIVDDAFVVVVNGHHEDVKVRMPSPRYGAQWAVELSTSDPEVAPGAWTVEARQNVFCPSRSVTVLKRVEARQEGPAEEAEVTPQVAEAADEVEA